MANAIYDAAKTSFLTGQINMSSNDIRVILINGSLYVPNFATDVFLSSVAAGARVAVGGPLTTKTISAGVFDSDDVSIPAVGPAATVITALLMYQHTGVDGTSRLIEWKDSFPGLPLVANGGPVAILWGSFIFGGFGVCP